jgi:hypothetical protein
MSRSPARHDYRPLPRQPAALRDGTCATPGADPALWAAKDPARQSAAISACLACPALAPCRSWALSLRPAADEHLILGGLLPSERARIRRERQRHLEAAAARLPCHQAGRVTGPSPKAGPRSDL